MRRFLTEEDGIKAKVKVRFKVKLHLQSSMHWNEEGRSWGNLVARSRIVCFFAKPLNYVLHLIPLLHVRMHSWIYSHFLVLAPFGNSVCSFTFRTKCEIKWGGPQSSCLKNLHLIDAKQSFSKAFALLNPLWKRRQSSTSSFSLTPIVLF